MNDSVCRYIGWDGKHYVCGLVPGHSGDHYPKQPGGQLPADQEYLGNCCIHCSLDPDSPRERGKSDMRGHIHTHGIESAAVAVAARYAAPFDTADSERLAGMILAAYEAGQLDGITKATA